MSLVRQERWQLGIRRTLGFIFSCSPMGQIIPAQDPIYGSDGWQRLYTKLFHLQVNGLSATEQVLVVEIESNHLNDFFNLCRRAHGNTERPP